MNDTRLNRRTLIPFVMAIVCLSSTETMNAAGLDPILKSSWPGYPRGLTYGVAVSGSYAYLANDDGGLHVVDISNAANPRRIGVMATPSVARSLVVFDHYVLLADGPAGLILIDVADPANPKATSWRDDTPGRFPYAYEVALANGHALVGRGSGILQAYDLSDPARPRQVGSIELGGGGIAVLASSVVGTYAYVIEQYSGLHVVDIQDPSAMKEVGALRLDWAQGVWAAGTNAYVTSAGDFRVLDISNPASPKESGRCRVLPNAMHPVVVGNTALVPSLGLEVVDVSNKQSPTNIGRYSANVQGKRLVVQGNRAYFAATSEFQILDLTDPTAPSLIGSYITGHRAGDVAVTGQYAYLADGSGLHILDVVDLAELSTFGTNGVAGVAIKDHWAFTAMGRHFTVLDIADRLAPRLVAETTNLVNRLFVSGDYVYGVANAIGLSAISISDPVSPASLGVLKTPGGAYDVAVSGNYAYVADGWEGLTIVDVSNPANMHSVGGLSTTLDALAVAVSGNYVFVAIGTGSTAASTSNGQGLEIIDMTHPLQPRRVTYLRTTNDVTGITVEGKYAYAAARNEGLLVLDISNPTAPKIVGRSSFPARGRMAVQGGKIFDAAGTELLLFEIPPVIHSLACEGSNLRITWESFGPAQLQRSSSPSGPVWETLPGYEGTNTAIQPMNTPGAFFRLKK